MSFFQGLGNFAGGVSQGASPYIQMMMRDKMEQDKEDRDSKSITDAMAMATNQQPIGSADEVSQVDNLIKGYQADADTRGVSAEDRIQEMAGIEASKSMLEKKASLVDQLAGTDPMAARGMYVDKLLQNGMKVDKHTMGVFDLFSKDIAAGKEQLIAEEDRTLKSAQTKAQGIAVQAFFQDKPEYAPIFKELEANGVPIEAAAPLLSTLIKDSNNNDSLVNKLLIATLGNQTKTDIAGQNNDTKELIASQGNDTKQLIAAIHGASSGSNDYWKQMAHEEKVTAREEKKKEKIAEQKDKDTRYLMDRKADRTANAKKVMEAIPSWKNMKSDVEKQKAIDGYIKSGIVPTIKTDANGVHYASFGTKSSPTQDTGRNAMIKQIKASYPNATQGQIDAFLKQKGM